MARQPPPRSPMNFLPRNSFAFYASQFSSSSFACDDHGLLCVVLQQHWDLGDSRSSGIARHSDRGTPHNLIKSSWWCIITSSAELGNVCGTDVRNEHVVVVVVCEPRCRIECWRPGLVVDLNYVFLKMSYIRLFTANTLWASPTLLYYITTQLLLLLILIALLPRVLSSESWVTEKESSVTFNGLVYFSIRCCKRHQRRARKSATANSRHRHERLAVIHVQEWKSLSK